VGKYIPYTNTVKAQLNAAKKKRRMLMIIPQEVCKKIERYLFNSFEVKEQLQIEIEDATFGVKSRHLGEETGGGMSNGYSSKTEDAALKIIEIKESEDAKWCELIEEILNELKNTEFEKVVDLTFNKQYRIPKIVRLLNMDRSTYYNKRNDIVMYVALKASEKGLLKNSLRQII